MIDDNRHQLGGIGQLLHIAVPLMISELSAGAMIFVDRLILSHYSIDAMNAAAAAGLASMIFIFSSMSICAIAEVFVGQYNGMGKFKKVPIAVWQMVILAISLNIIFIPAAIWGSSFFLAESLEELGVPYLKVMLFCASLYPISAALTGFFIGLGATKIITYTVILSNLCNLLLDLALIFGVEGIVPSMGTAGAAIATCISEGLVAIILLCVMLNKHNRTKYGTDTIRFDKEIFKKCIALGAPSAISHMFEMIAWALVYFLAANASMVYITTLTMGQNMFMMLAFMLDGMHKAVAAISANIIGAKKLERMNVLLSSAFKVQGVILIVCFIPLWLVPEIPLSLFNIDDLQDDGTIKEIVLTLRYVWFYMLFDGAVWMLSGVLTSGGDTKFIMFTNVACVWLFGVLPKYIAISYFNAPASLLWLMSVLYAIFNLLILSVRYYQGNWLKMDLNQMENQTKS